MGHQEGTASRLFARLSGIFIPTPCGRLLVQLLFWGILGVLALLCLNASIGPGYPWVNHDVASSLAAGQRLADGDRLYVDWIDNNPPFYYFFCEGVVKISRWLQLSAVATYHLSVLFLTVPGWLLLKRAMPPLNSSDDPFIFTGTAYLLAAVLANFEGSDFGQREHLFALLFIPYALWRVLDGKRSASTVLYLLILGCFASMKPDFFGLVLLIEFYCGFVGKPRLGRWFLNAGAVAAGFAMPYAILCFHSMNSLRQFLDFILPFHLSGGHDAYFEEGGWLQDWWFSQNPASTVLLLVGIICACLVWRLRLDLRRHLILGALLMTGAVLSIQLQHKFWSYHFAVLFALLLIFDAFLLQRLFVHCLKSHRVRLIGGSVLVGFTLWLLGPRLLSQFERLGSRPETEIDILEPALSEVLPGEKILFLSPSIDFSHTLIFRNIRSAGPWAFNFTLPAIVRLQSQTERDRLLKRYIENLQEVIHRERPRLLCFSPSTQALDGRTIHQILVMENGLLSHSGYQSWKSCSETVDLKDWIVYEPASGAPDCR